MTPAARYHLYRSQAVGVRNLTTLPRGSRASSVPPLELAPVEQIGVGLGLGDLNARGSLSAKDPDADLRRMPAVFVDAVDVPADHAPTDVLVQRHVDGNVGRSGNL